MFAYRKIGLSLILCGLIFCATSSVRAQESGPIVLEDAHTPYPLDLHLEILEDPSGKLTIDEVSGPEFADRFNLNQVDVPNFGVTESAYWIRFRIRNDSSQVNDWRLAFTDARLGLIDLYYQSQDATGWMHQQAGYFLPSTVREYAHPYFVFPLLISPSSEGAIYLRLQSNIPIRFSLSLWPEELFEQQNHKLFLMLGLVYGIIGIMFVYNLIHFLFLRKISYLYYCLFIAVLLFNMGSIDGIAYLYFFPYWTHKFTLLATTTLTTIFGILFIRDFLELKERLPWLDRILLSLVVLSGLLYLPFLLSVTGAYTWINLTPVLAAVLAILGALLTWRQGLRAARYFLIAWTGLLLNVIYRNLSALAFLPSSSSYDWHFYIANVWMVTFLSLALVDQINELKIRTAQAETARRASDERFRLVYESAPLGIAIADPKGLIEQTNSAYQVLLGYDENELYNLDYLNLIHPEDRQASQQIFRSLVQGERSFYEADSRFIRKDGNVVWVRRSVSALRNEKGNVSHTFAILADITQRKDYEEKLLSYSEDLEKMVSERTRELEHRREQLAILNRASQAVNAAGLDVDKLYVAIRAASAWLVPAEVFAICMVDRSAGEFEDVFLADSDRRIYGERHPLENSVVEKILANRTSVKIDDFQSYPDENWGSHWANYCPGVRSGMAVLLRGDKEYMGLLSVLSYQPNAYQDSDLSALESLAAHASIAIENVQLHQQAQKAVVIEERQRLARELHDSVTQLLYSIALLGGGWRLKASQGRLADPKSSFAQIEDLSLQALKEMRLLIYQLRPPLLDELGLVNALQHRLETVEQRVNIDARLKIEGDLPALPRKVEEEIYHIVQEALNNALRHAHATTIQINMQLTDHQFHIAVIDNGRGIDLSKGSKGMGLQTMRERAKVIGAEIYIDSKTDQGTKIEVTVGV